MKNDGDSVSFLIYSRAFAAMLAFVLLVLNVAAVLAGILLGAERASVENGFIENTQMVVLLAAALAFVHGAARSNRAVRFILAGGAALALLMANRELASDFVPADHWLHFVKSFFGRLVFWLAVAAAFAIWAYKLRHEIRRLVRHLDLNGMTPPLLFAGALVASYFTEEAIKAGFGGDYKLWLVFLEETLEANGYMVLCSAAVYFALRARRAAAAGILPGSADPPLAGNERSNA